MMTMTNYMDLLAVNSPWNLIFFMVIPVVAAEALVAAEFYTLFLGEGNNTGWRKIEKILGIFAGVYFAGGFVYLLVTVIPTLEWKGILDEIAIIAYLLGIIPLGGIALMELGVLWKHATLKERTKKHFELLIIFLIISHIAMIFGMVDPTLSGWKPEETATPMHHQMDMGHDQMHMKHDSMPMKHNSMHMTHDSMHMGSHHGR